MKTQKQNLPILKRASTLLSLRNHHPVQTLAELNRVSAKLHTPVHNPSKPFRILLPDYFNIPKFKDPNYNCPALETELSKKMAHASQLRRKMKDIEMLAEGMRRAKNIKEQSRYYFTQAVHFHNSKMYQPSIFLFEKFLKIVLFIKDDKSMELALNSIGIAYMYLGDHSKSIQYHKKQRSISQRSDQFPGHLNQGICHQLLNDYAKALASYEKAKQLVQASNQIGKAQLVDKFMQRLRQKMYNKENEAEQSNFYLTRSVESTSRQHSMQKSFSKDEKVFRVHKAIVSAEKSMSSFLRELKQSFSHQKQ